MGWRVINVKKWNREEERERERERESWNKDRDVYGSKKIMEECGNKNHEGRGAGSGGGWDGEESRGPR